jgi:hypothetical protein
LPDGPIIYIEDCRAKIASEENRALTSSFLLYMLVFAALAGGKVALQAQADGKIAPAQGKVVRLCDIF